MKYITIIDKEEFKNSGDIVSIKFKTSNELDRFDKPELKSFVNVLFGIMHSTRTFNTEDILNCAYNNELKVSTKILELNTEKEEDIEIVDIKRISSTAPIEDVRCNSINYHDDSVMLLYLDNNKGVKKEKSYTDRQVFLKHLMDHVVKTKPICLKEGDLLEEIKKIESDKKGNSYQEFISKAVLGEQVLEDYDKTIKELLEEFKIDIVDFEYL
jgi:hypothetical protein